MTNTGLTLPLTLEKMMSAEVLVKLLSRSWLSLQSFANLAPSSSAEPLLAAEAPRFPKLAKALKTPRSSSLVTDLIASFGTCGMRLVQPLVTSPGHQLGADWTANLSHSLTILEDTQEQSCAELLEKRVEPRINSRVCERPCSLKGIQTSHPVLLGGTGTLLRDSPSKL